MSVKKETISTKQPCVYILECGDGSLYTGWTNDIKGRIAAHSSGKGCKYTRARLPVRLIYVELLNTKSDALKREAAIKQMSRKQKLKLIDDPASKNAIAAACCDIR